jgi:hypothetical protein
MILNVAIEILGAFPKSLLKDCMVTECYGSILITYVG